LVDKAAINREAQRYLDMLGLDVSPTARMENLSVGECQIVEIARALAMGSHIVIFDEPTSSLSFKERDALFRVIARLKREGKAVIYITHFLDEILQIGDAYVVLRGGEVQGAGQIASITKPDLVRMIAGRDISVEGRVENLIENKPILRIDGLTRAHLLQDISFEIHEGEILGLWGLMGSGRTELVRAIVGLDPIDSGAVQIRLADRLTPTPPRQMLKYCGYVTESRRADGLFLGLPVWKNITSTSLDNYASRFGRFLSVKSEIATSMSYVDSLRIAGQGAHAKTETLSGGNQQKVVFAKWLNRRPKVLLLDEPTRGVDISAKRDIAGLIRQLAGEGTAVLLITSEVEEMVSLSDRVIVMRDHRLVGTLTGSDITTAIMMNLALGSEPAHA
jgi:ABC-type sugar transport system ATPase subunit